MFGMTEQNAAEPDGCAVVVVWMDNSWTSEDAW